MQMAVGTPQHQSLFQIVAHRLNSSSRSHLRTLTIEVNCGIVILSGVLPSFYMKQLAQELIASISGVEQIQNETVVCRP